MNAIGETVDALIERAARTAHEVNRAYCAGLDDHSQPPWESAPDWQKASAMDGARAIWINPATSPRESHAGWMEQKRADGWQYGPVKDAEKKEHPCFVEYDQLPQEQIAKDILFGATVRGVFRLPHAAP